MDAESPLRILHVLRAPVGGLFRHVVDLARAQAEQGHAVGVIADAKTGAEAAEKAFEELVDFLKLGIFRFPMSRDVGIHDVAAIQRVAEEARKARADVLHGHGAKGGAYARLARTPALRVYTPHGGSLHYGYASPLGAAYLASERLMRRRTDLVLFESEYGRDVYRRKVGEPRFARVVHNGVRPEELEPIEPDADGADFVYVGELREIKGVDVLIDALALLAAKGWNGSAVLYGEGPDRGALESRVGGLGLAHQVHFPGFAPARSAFRSGRVLIVPSRAESLPYIVLEAAAACVPMVATRVGGIPEIYGPDADRLVPAGDPNALAAAIGRMRGEGAPDLVQRLHDRVARQFTVEAMTRGILAAYDEALDARAALAR